MSSFINPIMPFTSFVVKQYIIIIIIPVPHKNVGIGEFCEGSAPFLLDIKQKAGWLVGMITISRCPCTPPSTLQMFGALLKIMVTLQSRVSGLSRQTGGR